jgi:hypothetical protein
VRHGIYLYPALLSAAIAAASPAFAQQSSSSDQPASAAQAPPAAAPTGPAGPSAETLKKAKSLGLKPEMHGGKQQYCYEDASVGSRFPTKKCVDENQLTDLIALREAVKENMRQSMTGSSTR